MEIKKIFDCFSIELLKWATGEDWILISDAAEIFSKTEVIENDKNSLLEIISSFYGVDILNHVRFRQLLLSTLPESEIYTLAKMLTSKVYSKADDNVRNLANLNWNTTSKLLIIFSQKFGFGSPYLPSKFQSMPVMEDIEPVGVVGKLFDYQQEVVKQCENLLARGTVKFLVQLPTGSGKTRIVMEIIKRRLSNCNESSGSRPILWMAHSSELLEQAIESFKKIWMSSGSKPIRIIRLYGRTKFDTEDFDDTFIFASLQKLSSMQKARNPQLKKLISCLDLGVVDEAHKITAPTYSKTALDLLKSGGFLIGVTATPGRSVNNDMENRKFVQFFGGFLVKPALGENPVEELRERGILAKIEKVDLITNINFINEIHSTGGDFTNASLERIGRSKERNKIILDMVNNEVNLGHSTIIFSCSLKHSELLCAGLSLLGIKSAHISYKMSINSRLNMINAFKKGEIKVIVNFGILSTGFDAPNIRTVVIARPTSSVVLYSQMIGRGLRGPLVGGSKDCKLIDVKDNHLKLGSVNDINNYFSEYWTVTRAKLF